jgi:hypothetical protein
MISIMDEHLKRNETATLPVVYPMIMYSGKEKYNYSTNLFDLFGEQNKVTPPV